MKNHPYYRDVVSTQSKFNVMFVVSGILVVLIWATIGFFGYKFYKSVSEVGMKKTVGIIWEGPGNSTIKGEK